jgi:hypothetical protein
VADGDSREDVTMAAEDDTYLMLVDGKVQPVDLGPMLRRHRAEIVRHRADAVDEVADLAACPGFDLDDVCASGEARIGEAGVDAALGVVLELQQIEMLRW